MKLFRITLRAGDEQGIALHKGRFLARNSSEAVAYAERELMAPVELNVGVVDRQLLSRLQAQALARRYGICAMIHLAKGRRSL